MVADQIVFTGFTHDSLGIPVSPNLVIHVVGDHLELNWQSDPEAVDYIIWTADVPDGSYTILDVVSDTSYQVSYSTYQKRFFRVEAQFSTTR